MLSNLRRLHLAAGVDPEQLPPRPLSAPRQDLDHKIILLAVATKAAEAAAKPVQRLSEVITEHERRLGTLQVCFAADRARLAAMISDGAGELSYTSSETTAANAAVAELAEAVMAARQGMGPAEAAHRAAIAAVTAATTARDESLPQVALEACETIAAEMVERLTGYLRIEAQLRSVVGELRARGDAGNSPASAAAVQVDALIRHARQTAGAPYSDAGARLVQALMTDPTAELGE